MADLFGWMGRARPTVLGRGPIDEAIDDATKNRTVLSRHVQDGRLAIDDDAFDKASRCVAIGGKNWMLAGNTEGVRRAPILFRLVLTRREIGIDSKECFRDVFLRVSICPDVANLTLLGWKHDLQTHAHADHRHTIEWILLEARGFRTPHPPRPRWTERRSPNAS